MMQEVNKNTLVTFFSPWDIFQSSQHCKSDLAIPLPSYLKAPKHQSTIALNAILQIPSQLKMPKSFAMRFALHNNCK
jgi:hypothetical protein